VAHHQQLGFLRHLSPGQQHQDTEQAACELISDREDHAAMMPAGLGRPGYIDQSGAFR
jgi:hypothetical protein